MSETITPPMTLFKEWFLEAQKSEPDVPEAMSVATSTASGTPSVRVVLLKAYDERGFVFYTNLGSRKAQELNANSRAALCFHWKSLKKEVRIEGTVELVSSQEADDYFSSRPRLSQLGAWASKQSQPLKDRFELERRVAEFTAKFHIGKVPRPEFWSGFRVLPERIEFWHEMPFRLHDRFVYSKTEQGWKKQRIFP